MLKWLFVPTLVAAVARAQVPAPGSVIDYASACGFATPEASVVKFSFGDGAQLIRDGDIVTASLSLDAAYHEDPPASVAISAPGVTCGRSVFAFDASDPSTFDQTVTCRTDGGVVAAGLDGSLVDIALALDFTEPSASMEALFKETMRRTCLKLLLQRQLGDSGQGGGTGDPHLTTFDKVNYDFQVPGVFRLFQSRNLLVQVFQEKCAPVAWRGGRAPSCYQGVAVAFAGSLAKFFIQDGKIQVGKGTSSLGWLSVERLRGKTDGYRVFVAADHATFVDVTLGTWINNYAYLNIAVKASPYFKDPTVRGLLGNWNGDKRDDLRDNAQLAKLHGAALDHNLFTCVGDACAPFLEPASLKDDMARGLPNNMTRLHQSYAVVSPATIPLRAFAPALVPFVAPKTRHLRGMGAPSNASGNASDTITFPPSQAPDVSHDDDAALERVARRAHELCPQVIGQVPACAKYVPNTAYYTETVCEADAALMGDLSVVDSTKLSYLRECRRMLDGLIEGNTSTIPEMNVILADRAMLAFGDISTCANHCSGRGTCLAAGCKCDAGFTGFMCDIAI